MIESFLLTLAIMKKLLPILLMLFVFAGCKKDDPQYSVRVEAPEAKPYTFYASENGPRITLYSSIYEQELKYSKKDNIDIQVISVNGVQQSFSLVLYKDGSIFKSASGKGNIRIEANAD